MELDQITKSNIFNAIDAHVAEAMELEHKATLNAIAKYMNQECDNQFHSGQGGQKYACWQCGKKIVENFSQGKFQND